MVPESKTDAYDNEAPKGLGSRTLVVALYRPLFVLGLVFWWTLLLYEVEVQSHSDILSLETPFKSLSVHFSSYSLNDHVPRVVRQFIPNRLSIQFPRHNIRGLFCGLVALPFLLAWGWGKAGNIRRWRVLLGIAVASLVLPLMGALVFVASKLEWPPATPLYFFRGLAFSTLILAIPFLPALRDRLPQKQLLLLALILLSTALLYNAFTAATSLDRGFKHWRYHLLEIPRWRIGGQSGWYWVPTWVIAVFAYAAAHAALSRHRVSPPRRLLRPVLVGVLALGLTFFLAHLHEPKVTFEPLVPKFYSPQDSSTLYSQPKAVQWQKERYSGILKIPVARYEVTLPVGPAGARRGFEYIESAFVLGPSSAGERWDLEAFPFITMQNGEPESRLSLLLRNWKNPELLAAKETSLTVRVSLQLTRWQQVMDFGSAKTGMRFTQDGVVITLNRSPRITTFDEELRYAAVIHSRLWAPCPLWAGHESRIWMVSQSKMYLVGDFHSASGVIFRLYDRGRRIQRGTSLERRILKPGEFVYPGDLIEDPVKWWNDAEVRGYEQIGSRTLDLELHLKLPSTLGRP